MSKPELIPGQYVVINDQKSNFDHQLGFIDDTVFHGIYNICCLDKTKRRESWSSAGTFSTAQLQAATLEEILTQRIAWQREHGKKLATSYDLTEDRWVIVKNNVKK